MAMTYVRRDWPEVFDAVLRTLWAHDADNRDGRKYAGTATIGGDVYRYSAFPAMRPGGGWGAVEVRIDSSSGYYWNLEDAAGSGVSWDVFGPGRTIVGDDHEVVPYDPGVWAVPAVASC